MGSKHPISLKLTNNSREAGEKNFIEWFIGFTENCFNSSWSPSLPSGRRSFSTYPAVRAGGNDIKDNSFLVDRNFDVVLSAFVPVKIYSDTEIDKSQLLSDNKGKAGIYQWTHKESGKRYVGSAFDISKRIYYYFNKKYLVPGAPLSMFAEAPGLE
jgi:hypothetical protein